MNNPAPTAEQIVEKAKSARAKLVPAVTDINRRRRELQEKKVSAAGLTSAEHAELDRLDAGSAELHDAIEVLIATTLEAINDSEEVKELRKNLKNVNDNLKVSIDKVNETVKYVQDAAMVLAAVAQVATAVAAL